jgi:hypothetical protein
MQVVKKLSGMEVSGVSENTVTEIKLVLIRNKGPGHDSLE